jgi:hypothetical protein
VKEHQVLADARFTAQIQKQEQGSAGEVHAFILLGWFGSG